MPPANARIIIADAASPWRSALLEGLASVESSIRVTEFGQDLRRVLEETAEPPRVIVIGGGLKGVGGLEALYLAERSLLLEKKRRPEWPNRTVSLVTEVRSDNELLDLYRRRGVNQFIYRDDPLERTVGTMLASFHRSARAMVRIDAVLTVGDQRVQGAVYDLSRTGAKVVLATHALDNPPAIGDTVGLRMTFHEHVLDWKGEVRRHAVRPGSMGDRLLIGVQFIFEDGAVPAILETLIRDAAEELEIVRSD